MFYVSNVSWQTKCFILYGYKSKNFKVWGFFALIQILTSRITISTTSWTTRRKGPPIFVISVIGTHPSNPWGLQGISVLGGDQDVTGQAPE